jgi:hypothetical protein
MKMDAKHVLKNAMEVSGVGIIAATLASIASLDGFRVAKNVRTVEVTRKNVVQAAPGRRRGAFFATVFPGNSPGRALLS